MSHTAKCAEYGTTGFTNDCDLLGDTAQVKADEQIQLLLAIDDAFYSHTVSPPTYIISDEASAKVEDLTAEYNAMDGDENTIALVQDSNKKVTLRALAFAGQEVSITWEVERVAGNRRLLSSITYRLGGDVTSNESSNSNAGFQVIAASREGVSFSHPNDFTHTHNLTHTHHEHTHDGDHHPKKDDDDSWGMWTVFILGAGLLLTVALFVVFSTGEKEVVYTSDSSGFKSRFYNYSKVDTRNVEPVHPALTASVVGNRNRFKHKS